MDSNDITNLLNSIYSHDQIAQDVLNPDLFNIVEHLCAKLEEFKDKDFKIKTLRNTMIAFKRNMEDRRYRKGKIEEIEEIIASLTARRLMGDGK